MTQKFYQDYAAWLDSWLQQNVGDEPARLYSSLPADLTTRTLSGLAVVGVFNFINRQCRLKPEKWSKIPPQQKTADIFYCSRWEIARAIQKYSTLM